MVKNRKCSYQEDQKSLGLPNLFSFVQKQADNWSDFPQNHLHLPEVQGKATEIKLCAIRQIHFAPVTFANQLFAREDFTLQIQV